MSCGSTPGNDIVNPPGLRAKWTRRREAGQIPNRTKHFSKGLQIALIKG